MKVEYYPGDIAAALADYIGETAPETRVNIESALYSLQAIAANHYNANYYRDFYRALERLTAKRQEVQA